MNNAVFWDLAPCRSCVYRSFGGTHYLHLQGRKMEAICSSETSFHTRSPRRHIPEDGILHVGFLFDALSVEQGFPKLLWFCPANHHFPIPICHQPLSGALTPIGQHIKASSVYKFETSCLIRPAWYRVRKSRLCCGSGSL
jgi:hypothetical protein